MNWWQATLALNIPAFAFGFLLYSAVRPLFPNR